MPPTGGIIDNNQQGPWSPDNPQTLYQNNPNLTIDISDGPAGAFDHDYPGYNKIENQQSAPQVWTDCVINNRYEKDLGIYMAGMTSPNGFAAPGTPSNQRGTVAFFQLHAPTLLLISDWTVAKCGAKPAIPDSAPNNPNLVLLDEHYETGKVVVGPDGLTPLYRISGTFVYGHRNPSLRTLNDVVFTRPPWLLDAFDRKGSTVPVEQGLIN